MVEFQVDIDAAVGQLFEGPAAIQSQRTMLAPAGDNPGRYRTFQWQSGYTGSTDVYHFCVLPCIETVRVRMELHTVEGALYLAAAADREALEKAYSFFTITYWRKRPWPRHRLQNLKQHCRLIDRVIVGFGCH